MGFPVLTAPDSPLDATRPDDHLRESRGLLVPAYKHMSFLAPVAGIGNQYMWHGVRWEPPESTAARVALYGSQRCRLAHQHVHEVSGRSPSPDRRSQAYVLAQGVSPLYVSMEILKKLRISGGNFYCYPGILVSLLRCTLAGKCWEYKPMFADMFVIAVCARGFTTCDDNDVTRQMVLFMGVVVGLVILLAWLINRSKNR